jgi:hypothetical protein
MDFFIVSDIHRYCTLQYCPSHCKHTKRTLNLYCQLGVITVIRILCPTGHTRKRCHVCPFLWWSDMPMKAREPEAQPGHWIELSRIVRGHHTPPYKSGQTSFLEQSNFPCHNQPPFSPFARLRRPFQHSINRTGTTLETSPRHFKKPSAMASVHCDLQGMLCQGWDAFCCLSHAPNATYCRVGVTNTNRCRYACRKENLQQNIGWHMQDEH